MPSNRLARIPRAQTANPNFSGSDRVFVHNHSGISASKYRPNVTQLLL
jgi:hypothetical protein